MFSALVANDFEHGVLLAVNHGGDSDSTGSIAGNILGLLHGEGTIPKRWLDELELHDGVRPPDGTGARSLTAAPLVAGVVQR